MGLRIKEWKYENPTNYHLRVPLGKISIFFYNLKFCQSRSFGIRLGKCSCQETEQPSTELEAQTSSWLLCTSDALKPMML